MRLPLEAVELKVDLETGHVVGQSSREVRFVGNPDAVGVDHDVANGTSLGLVEDTEEVGMQGWLSP